MPLLQQNKNRNFFIRLVIGISVPVLGGVFSLIVVYNQVVTSEHEVLKINKTIEETQAATANLKEQVFALFSGDSVEKLTKERGLIREKNPEYFEDLSAFPKAVSVNLR